MIIPLVLWLVSNIHAAVPSNPCPAGNWPKERTLVIYTPNDTPKSKEHILQHFKFMVGSLKGKHQATVLYQESNPDHGVFLYSIATEEEVKKMIALDPLSSKNLYNIAYERLTECKG